MTHLKKRAADPAFKRASYCKTESRRPICPSCNQRMPHPDSPQWAGWSEPWAHRREVDNEPCPAWKSQPSIAPPPPVVTSPAKLSPVQEWYAWIDRHVAAVLKPKAKPQKREPVASNWEQLSLFDRVSDEPEQTRYPVDTWSGRNGRKHRAM